MMRFNIEPWTIKKLVNEYNCKNLNLTPPYQRNNIWTEKSQKSLISSIKAGLPIPTFFLHSRGNNKYDIADGQQRTRAILAYISGEIADLNNVRYTNDKNFLSYEIPVVIIEESVSQEDIRHFYVIVNNTGLKLNKPELNKAEYFNSAVLKLVEELVNNSVFQKIDIFSDKQSDRMIDRDFVEELVAQLKYGIGDKKNDVKKLYESKIDDVVIIALNKEFTDILSVIVEHPNFKISETRYAQRNDFYTLFGFINSNKHLKKDTFEIFFDVLTKIQYDISPSNERSLEMQFYALNCVSQSNSKIAREDRLSFFSDLLLNRNTKPNKLQKSLLKYYNLQQKDVIKTADAFIVVDPSKIETQFKK